MSDPPWKAFERRLCRDVGTERIPVTGERLGADGRTLRGCYQFKLRRRLPSWLWAWVGGICQTAQTEGRLGVLVVKQPRMRDADALVVLRWADWVALQDPTAQGFATAVSEIVSWAERNDEQTR